MKFILALAFLAVVCAIPHQGRIPVNNQELERRESLPRTRQIQIEDANVNPKHSPTKQHENSDESDEVEYEDDEDDSDKRNNLSNLISALNSIREKLKNKIHDKLDHNDEDSANKIRVQSGRVPVNDDSSQDNAAEASLKQNIKEKLKNNIQDKRRHNYEDSANEVHVPSERVPLSEDYAQGSSTEAPQKQNNSERVRLAHRDLPQKNSAVSNSTNGNVTASNHKPIINITQIIQKIHEKIDNVIINILRPWLGNNSVEESVNGTTTNQPGNATEPPQRNITAPDVSGNSTEAPKPENKTVSISPHPSSTTVTEAPKPRNNSVTVAPQSENEVTVVVTKASEPGNNSETIAPQSENDSTEVEDATIDIPEVSINSEVSQGEEESESTSDSHVRFVNV